MCKKKLLSAAIGTALAMGSWASYAGTLALTTIDGTSTAEAAVYASEDIGVSGTQIITDEFVVTYTLGKELIDTTLYVNFTLNGATWQEALTSEALKLTSNIPVLSIVKDGAIDQSTVQFLVEAGDDDLLKDNPLVFTFKVADIYDLSSPGGEISLTIELTSAASGNTADTTESKVIAISGKAVDVEVQRDDANPRAAIDVAQGGTVFIDALDDTIASLGTIKLAEASSSIKSINGTDYNFSVTSGSLTLLNGVFAASLENNGVFIDVGGTTNVYDDGIDFAADELSATEAKWTFTPAQLTTLYDSGVAKDIIVTVDGTTSINDNTDPPSATLLVEFETDRIVSGTLKHVERNGTTCTLYNIPADGAVDLLNIRVTNNSATKTGLVLGTLWDKSGTALFSNQTLVAELAPLGTVRITATELAAALSEASGGATTTWAGRAILVLSSDLTDMEAFNLLRNAAGGPLLNMSTGGTGNSCD